MMNLETLINTYGYAAIVIGTFMEGETVVILGGIAAKLGYLQLQWIILSAFAGTVLGDQLFFFLGRFKGQAILGKWPSLVSRMEKVDRVLERHRIPVILGFRFIYGFRSITPLVLGMSRVPIIVFMVLNIISAAIWAIAIGTLGYAFGHGLELILGDIHRYETTIIGVVVIIAFLIWIIQLVKNRKQRKQST